MKKLFWIIAIVLILFVAGVFYLSWHEEAPTVGRVVPITSLDGAVERVVEQSELAEAQNAQSHGKTIAAKIGERGVNGTVAITPLEILEDNRCALNELCLDGGTVRIRTTLESGSGKAPQVFSLDVPITTETEEIVLFQVQPPRISGANPKPGDYQFFFQVTKR